MLAVAGFIISFDTAWAEGLCPGNVACPGSITKRIAGGCSLDLDNWVCVRQVNSSVTFICDGDCEVKNILKDVCLNDPPTCPIDYQLVTYDCCPGGGGSDYSGPKCTDPGYPGGNLTCELPATNTCMKYKGNCDVVFPAAKTYDNCDGEDLGYTTCQTNCGCCPSGEIFSCDGSTYSHTFTTYGWTINGVAHTPDQNPYYCANTNDVAVSGVRNSCVRDADNQIVSCEYTTLCKTCGCSPICTDAAPDAPVISTPTNGQQ
ncbi:hypothetical protein COU88_01405, partial [Candidatus Roizmanbacteria bacterium CG10_big_fil_rev_8_21_14_0_10_39_6]